MNIDEWLESQVPRWRGYLQRQIDEKNTEDKVVDPLLRQLGWDLAEFDQVTAQAPVGSEAMDHVLLDPEKRPLIAVEVKKLGTALGEAIRRGAIDEQKYLTQAKALGVQVLVLTTGLEFKFFAPDSQGAWAECRAAAINLSSPDPSEATLREAGAVLSLLARSAVLSSASLSEFSKLVGAERAERLVIETLKRSHPRVVKALVDTTRLPKSTIKATLRQIGLVEPSQRAISPPPVAQTPLSERDRKILRKMTDRTVGARRWRQKVSKYSRIWERLAERGSMPRSEVLDEVMRVVPAVKGRAVFFGAYVGRKAKTPLIEPLPETKDEQNAPLRIRAELREALIKMLQLLRTEAQDR